MMIQRVVGFRLLKPVFVLVLTFSFIAPSGFTTEAGAQEDNRVILMATTTSTENSGLMDYLVPYFTEDTGFSIKIISTGTGKALKMGQAGDVDVLLVHSTQSELEFVEAGHGVNRRQVMFNDFIIVGPKDPPTSIGSLSSAGEVFRNIATSQAVFISRGDDSGTHKKELSIWQSINVNPQGDWYREVGQGMGKTLQMANQLNAYTLTDRGTWIFSRDKLSMGVVFEGDEQLHNQYGVISINPKLDGINHQGATAFTDWITSGKGQRLISAYRINGQQLFYPNAE
jgi:tungstate transport system substrate-binding protein